MEQSKGLVSAFSPAYLETQVQKIQLFVMSNDFPNMFGMAIHNDGITLTSLMFDRYSEKSFIPILGSV